MEIDVTPEASAEKSDGASSQGEDENAEKAPLEEPPKTAKKSIKHALRQQAKRRRKNTTIASGNSSTVPRIIVKPLPPQPLDDAPQPSSKTPTMKEVLASIPGFTMKPRRRTNKKLSTAAQLEQTKEGCIDLETPDSILVNTNLRLLLNKATFASLPLLYQNKLVQLLPDVDRYSVTNSSDSLEMSNSGLNNEFFARACLEWQDRLAEGEFTPENQQKLKLEADKERSKLDPWKLKHFEPIWGDKSNSESVTNSSGVANNTQARPPIKTTIKLRPTAAVSNNKNKPPPPVKRLRTVGAMTRSCTSLIIESTESSFSKTQNPIPDLLPIKNVAKKDDVCVKNEEITAEKQENCIINISKAIMQTDEETIICSKISNNRVKSEKRRRSCSPDPDEMSPKRKSPSPLKEEVCETEATHQEPEEDVVIETEDVAEIATTDAESISDLIKDDDVKPSPSSPSEEIEESTTSTIATEIEIADAEDKISEIVVEKETIIEDLKEEELMVEDAFPILPNTLILQQECLEEAEKLEASVEESDLVMAQLTESNFERVDDDEANEDRFIDAENYVLESGQITVEDGAKEKEDVDIGTTLFGAEAAQGEVDVDVEVVLDVW